MKPRLEQISTSDSGQSFRYFKVSAARFAPFWHYHPAMELTFIAQGEGLRFVGDHIAPFSAGDLVLIGENLPHQWVSAEAAPEGKSCTAHVVQFSSSIVEPFPELRAVVQLLKSAHHGCRFSGSDLGEKMTTMETLPPAERLLQFLEILVMLTERQHQLLSSISYTAVNPFKKHQNRISKVSSFLIEKMDQPISLTQMAEQNHMTATSFSRWFKQSFGKGFWEYLQSLRVEKACQLLLTSDLPVAQIGFQVGFESLSSFNRNFNSMKGVSPSLYRKKAIPAK